MSPTASFVSKPFLVVPLALAILLLPGLAWAGGTPATPGGLQANELLTPGGGGAQPAVGDYITSAQGAGLDEPYILYIEVPPGQTELQVDLFDADIYAGGAADRTGERDRDRNSSTRTRVRYRLFDPSGAQVGTRFSYGDDNDPAGADAAWSLFYDDDTSGITGGTTYEDDFSTASSYGNNSGSANFATSWIESNDLGGAGAGAGDVRVAGGVLIISNASDTGPPFTNQPSVQREVDLTGFAAANMSFDWTTTAGVDALIASGGDSLAIEMSANGGVTWEEIDTLSDISGIDSGSEIYDITDFISANTRVRLRVGNRYAGTNESISIDNFLIRAVTVANGPDPDNGHWRLEIDTSGAINGPEVTFSVGGDDVNAVGLRAHDGTSGAGGQEYNVYADSFLIAGINDNDRSRTYDWYPWITSGCELTTHDFDWDANQPNPAAPNPNTQPYGSLDLTSRSGTFTHTNATMSDNDMWRDETLTGFTSADTATDYGIWQMDVEIEDWNQNNYGPVYLTEFDGSASPPTAQPESDTFRIYLPTDAGGAPAKPYLTQFATYLTNSTGSNPPTVGQTSRYAITVRVTNPASSIGDITFSNSDLVISNVPGGEVTYGGLAFVTSGSVVSQPTSGGSGDVEWNPGVLSPGDSENITYFVDVTPAAAYTTIELTGAPGSGNGTRATYLDETESAEARATFTFGEICELEIDSMNATQALVSSLRAVGGAARVGVWVEWRTAGEAETVRFDLLRATRGSSSDMLDVATDVPAQLDAPQGGVYRVLDATVSAAVGDSLVYALVETEPSGARQLHGPFEVVVDAPSDGASLRALNEPRPTPRRQLLRREEARIAGGASAAGAAKSRRQAPSAVVRAAGRGLLRIPLDAIADSLGIDAATIESHAQKGWLRVTSGGDEIAWRLDQSAARSAGSLEGLSRDFHRGRDGQNQDGQPQGGQAASAALELWLEPADDDTAVFDAERVVRVTLGQGRLMDVRTTSPPGAPWPDAGFRASLDVERDLRPVVQLPLDPAGDFWFWDFVRTGGAGDDLAKTFELQVPSARTDDGDGQAPILTARLQGGLVGSHRVEVSWNGAVLGQATVDGLEAAEASFELDAADLAGDVHAVEVRALDAGTLVFVDGFHLAYERGEAPVDGQLVRTAGGPQASAGPFASPQIEVFDLSDPRRPSMLADRTVIAADGGWRAIWSTGGSAGPFAARGADAPSLAPLSVAADVPSDLRSPRFQVDYLVIAASPLVDAASELAALRAAQGLDTLVVDVADVYDEFADGVRDPRALRDFLELAHSDWSRPPRWVVLAGGGSYDYRDILGLGGTLLPPLLSIDGSSLIASDQSFVDPDADGVPWTAIGRIPALTDSELRAYVDKLRLFESDQDASGWTSRVLLGVDAPDGVADFTSDAARLGGLLPAGFDVQTVDLAATPAPQDAFADALRAGVGWVSWIGHGGVDRLGRTQALLTSSDVDGLDNLPAPIVAAVSCLIGYHALPQFDTLGEELVVAPDGGATAVIAPVWLSDHPEAAPLADRLMRAVFQRDLAGTTTLGEALTTALSDAAAAGVDPELLRVYQILGDPATRLRSVPAPLDQDCDDACGGPG